MMTLLIIVGFLIVLLGIHLIVKELKKMNRFSSLMDENVLQSLDSFEGYIDKMNESFYEISNDLEGKYSLHERELRLLNKKIDDYFKALNEVSLKMDTLEQGIHNDFLTKNKIDTSDTKESVNDAEANDQNSLRAKIINLRTQGYSLKEIAKKLNIGLREIKLLISLKK